MIDPRVLPQFVSDSNLIEGVSQVLPEEITCVQDILDAETGDDLMAALCRYASATTGGEGLLRDSQGMDVRVGGYIAPPGGVGIRENLLNMCHHTLALEDDEQFDCPTTMYARYERLHPFLDGNGRTGRALWLRWFLAQHHRYIPSIGFLGNYHYQTLRDASKPCMEKIYG